MIRRFLLTSSYLLTFLFCSYFLGGYFKELRAQEKRNSIDLVISNIVNSMSESELVGQLIHITIPGTVPNDEVKQEMDSILPGGVILFGKNFGKVADTIALTKGLQEFSKANKLPPLFISTDQEGGRVRRVQDGVTQFPGAMALGQTKNPALSELVGFVTGYELKKVGINLVLAPILDVNNNPLNPVINTRSFGSNLETVNRTAIYYELGGRKSGILTTVKHFPGHGDTTVDSHLGLPIIQKTLEELEKLELVPFQKAIENGADSVMTAHILYPKIDPKYPATLSKIFLTDILRKKLGFQGLISTDAMEMHAISKNYEKDQPATLSLLAGSDIILLTSYGESARKIKAEVLKSYKEGKFFVDGQDLIKEKVKRNLKFKLGRGLYFENGFSLPELNERIFEDFQKDTAVREKIYQDYKNSNPDLAQFVSDQTIRAFPKELKPLKQGMVLIPRNPILKKEAEQLGIEVGTIKSISEYLKLEKYKTIVLESQIETDWKYGDLLAKSNPDKTIVLLHAYSPFLPIRERENLHYVFSFSTTDASFRSLARSLVAENPILAVDLVLNFSTSQKK